MNEQRVRCLGKTYKAASLVIHQHANADLYEDASAVCDGCANRLKLLRGRRIPAHWLLVTVHNVHVD